MDKTGRKTDIVLLFHIAADRPTLQRVVEFAQADCITPRVLRAACIIDGYSTVSLAQALDDALGSAIAKHTIAANPPAEQIEPGMPQVRVMPFPRNQVMPMVRHLQESGTAMPVPQDWSAAVRTFQVVDSPCIFWGITAPHEHAGHLSARDAGPARSSSAYWKLREGLLRGGLWSRAALGWAPLAVPGCAPQAGNVLPQATPVQQWWPPARLAALQKACEATGGAVQFSVNDSQVATTTWQDSQASQLTTVRAWLGADANAGATDELLARPAKLAMDVGSAPGGWSRALVELGLQRVIAVDPADMDPTLPDAVTHLRCLSSEMKPKLLEAGVRPGEVELFVMDANIVTRLTASALAESSEFLAAGCRVLLTFKNFVGGIVFHLHEVSIVISTIAPMFVPGTIRFIHGFSNGMKEMFMTGILLPPAVRASVTPQQISDALAAQPYTARKRARAGEDEATG